MPLTLSDGTQVDPQTLTGNVPPDPAAFKMTQIIQKLEGGNYQNRSGDSGASAGAYQWNNDGKPLKPGELPSHWKNAAAQYLHDANAPMTPENQNFVAYRQIKDWKDQGLSPEEIDALWNGAKKDPTTGKYTHVSAARQLALQNLVLGNVPSKVPAQATQQPPPAASLHRPQPSSQGLGAFGQAPAPYTQPNITYSGPPLQPAPTQSLSDQLNQNILKGAEGGLNLIGKASDLTGQAYNAYANSPIVKGITSVVGAPVAALGYGEGALVGGAADIYKQLVNNAGTNKMFNFGELGQSISDTAQKTGQFGFQTGQQAATAAPLGALGKIPNALLSVNQITQSVRNLTDALKSGDYEKAAEAGIQLGIGAYSAKGALQAKGLIFNKPIVDIYKQLTAPSQAQIVQRNLAGLDELEKRSAPVRKLIASYEAQGVDVKNAIANTNLLNGAVDANGRIDTSQGLQTLKDFLQPQESVVGDALKAEGKSIPFDQVKSEMIDAVNNSNARGAAKLSALARVNTELKGLAMDQNPDGTIDLAILHEAKISKYNNLDYTNPEVSNADKLIANTEKRMIENNSEVPVKDLNAELQGYYAMQDLLKTLSGKTVLGGRLGKYFAEVIGGGIGSHFGPLGTIAGAEVGRRILGKSMQGTFSGDTGQPLQQSGLMQTALQQNQAKQSVK